MFLWNRNRRSLMFSFLALFASYWLGQRVSHSGKSMVTLQFCVSVCMGGFLSPGQAWVVVNARDNYISQPAILLISVFRDLPNSFHGSEEAACYFHHVHKNPLPDSIHNTPIQLNPLATTKETQSDSFLLANDIVYLSRHLLLLLHSLEFRSLALQPLILPDSQWILKTSVWSMQRRRVLWSSGYLAKIVLQSPPLLNAYLLFLSRLRFSRRHSFQSPTAGVFFFRWSSARVSCHSVSILHQSDYCLPWPCCY